MWAVVGLCLGGVAHCSTYFPCTIASDCPGTCYFKSERPICGAEVIDGYLARICVCVANECNTDQQCSQHHCITGYKAVCSTTSHQCSCQHTCSRASDCVRYNCPHGGDIMCSSVYGSTSTCACQNGCSSNGDCSTNICSTGSTSVCDGGHCKCKATCHSDSDCPIFVTCQAGTMPYCSPSNKHTCECVAQPGYVRTCSANMECSKNYCNRQTVPYCASNQCGCTDCLAATDCRQYCPHGFERRCKNNRCVCESKSCTTHVECVYHQCQSGYTAACASNTHQCACKRICQGNNDCARKRCPNADPMCTPAQVNTRICSCETTCSQHGDCSNHHCSFGDHKVCDSGSCGCGRNCRVDSDCTRYNRCPSGKSPFCMAVSGTHACLCLECNDDAGCSHHSCGRDFHPKCSQNICTCDHNPINGHWSSWGRWNTCSNTCGTGTQTRQRSCNNPRPNYGGANCAGSRSDTQACNVSCIVDGQWSAWSRWTSCSTSCGPGSETRQRTCTNPAPAHGGKGCGTASQETKACNTKHCPVDGAWSRWGSWGACSTTCGTGVHIRYRSCDSPKPAYGGHNCRGANHQSQKCNLGPCPIHGGWSNWGSWGSCSVTCGAGSISRTRSCTHPAPSHGGKPCSGSVRDTQSCILAPCSRSCADSSDQCALLKDVFCAPGNVDGQNVCPQTCGLCPVDGSWGNWENWSVCTVTCGGGVRLRSRQCDNPAPLRGGVDCIGFAQEAGDCNAEECIVDGSWASWESWTTCSVTCDGGTSARFRSCSNPTPSSLGKYCVGPSFDVTACSQIPCPVNGNWSAWSDWSTCSVTCSVGVETRSRSCDNPPPQYNGHACVGNVTDTQPCNDSVCPYVCKDLSPECSTHKNVFCAADHPYGQQLCPVTCGTCRVDGKWSQWSAWSSCSVSCENGTRHRTRNCSDPAPAFGGKDCNETSSEIENCAPEACPIHGKWSDWAGWSSCSLTCGAGVQTRDRKCNNPAPSHNGNFCTGDPYEIKPCIHGCPVNGSWSDWSGWSLCSVTCGAGVLKRTRACTHPSPRFGGQNCNGLDTETQPCNKTECPLLCEDHDPGCTIFTSSICDVNNPQGRLMCPKSCGSCDVDGGWSSWGHWSECSATCGDLSVRKRNRLCNNPIPQNGGKACEGQIFELELCNVTSCPQGKPCPTCDEHLSCTWDHFCDDTETCMIRSYSGYNFTVHCSKKEDCSFEKDVLSSGEIFCCDDRPCLHGILTN